MLLIYNYSGRVEDRDRVTLRIAQGENSTRTWKREKEYLKTKYCAQEVNEATYQLMKSMKQSCCMLKTESGSGNGLAAGKVEVIACR